MNYLCVCQGGCVRSVALAYALKYRPNGNNAIAVGIDHMGHDLLEWEPLCEWADFVLTVSPLVTAAVKTILVFGEFRPELIEILIGDDVWGLTQGPYNADLMQKVHTLLDQKEITV